MELSLILIFAFCLRSIFLFTPSTDDYVHLWNIKQRKKIGNPFQHFMSDSAVDGKRGYPVLNHYLISFFPRQYWVFIGRILNIIYDLISISIIYLISYLLFNSYSYNNTLIGLSLHGLVSLIVATSPSLLPVTSRMQAIGSRSFGFLLVLCYFIILGYVLITKHYVFDVFAIAAVMLAILSSQFATQFLLFTSILVSLLYLNIIPILNILIIIFIGIVIPKTGLKDMFLFKIAHVKWYRKNYKGTTIEDRNNIMDLLMLPFYIFHSPSKGINCIFYRSSFLIALYSVPSLWLLGIIIINNTSQLSLLISDQIIFYSLAIIISTVLVFFLTSLKPFLIFGQAERYFEYAIPFIGFLLILLSYRYNLPEEYLIYLIIWQITVVLIHCIVINSSYLKAILFNTKSDDLAALVNLLNEKEESRILTIPVKLSFKLSYEVNRQHKWYYRHVNQGKSGFEYFGEDMVSLDIPINNMDHFKVKYNINTLIIEKEFSKKFEAEEIIKENNNLHKIYENSSFIVFNLV